MDETSQSLLWRQCPSCKPPELIFRSSFSDNRSRICTVTLRVAKLPVSQLENNHSNLSKRGQRRVLKQTSAKRVSKKADQPTAFSFAKLCTCRPTRILFFPLLTTETENVSARPFFNQPVIRILTKRRHDSASTGYWAFAFLSRDRTGCVLFSGGMGISFLPTNRFKVLRHRRKRPVSRLGAVAAIPSCPRARSARSLWRSLRNESTRVQVAGGNSDPLSPFFEYFSSVCDV